ncbi:DNA-binding IclR family transcriptional regulator [Streptosporangium becharense]|uniref:DNA-binding IclR family transcriptional regulator n=1 Tax=Streptosporangium becharense TaxID=1816182 RepID=A0A7W9IDM5_9ACTN|nr:IclR family transcriptional regulator [Streptosporangium becharense]MBB2912246.1 DNA-binding IclR family transcriptional regulator [Streptosporangium becharense]MBB5818793.1 DNA-binding IclR family transcriptional regulator [Streptosporangium becharense]
MVREGSSIDKALAVLEAIAEHHRVTDIAAATGVSKSTVHRILQSLVEWGFARADGSGGYEPGPRILTLAGRVMNRFDPARQASVALNALHERIGYTTHFAIRSGDEAVYVDKLEGRRPYQMPSRVGMSLRLHCTAIGKAILAQLGEDEVRAICARTGMPAATPGTLTTPDGLVAHLAEVRARGYALDDEENLPGILCVAAPVFDHTGQVLGGISISALAMDMSREDVERFAPEVVAAAKEVSRALGAPEPVLRG